MGKVMLMETVMTIVTIFVVVKLKNSCDPDSPLLNTKSYDYEIHYK